MIPSRSDIQPNADRLLPAYEDYITNVSSWQHAISLESAALFLWLLESTDAMSVLDTGSGFTSYVSRLYAADVPKCRVCSVDTDTQWLAKTATFISDHDLPVTGLCMADSLLIDERYDVIIHDLADGELREQWMPVVAKMLSPGGTIIFDDMQSDSHHYYAGAVCQEFGLVLYDAFATTCDQMFRYAAVAR